jgi:hypothetical protein
MDTSFVKFRSELHVKFRPILTNINIPSRISISRLTPNTKFQLNLLHSSKDQTRRRIYRHVVPVTSLPQSLLTVYNISYVNTCGISSTYSSVVGMVTGYELDDQGVGVEVPVGARIFNSLCRPGKLWGPSSLLSNGYRGLLPRG